MSASKTKITASQLRAPDSPIIKLLEPNPYKFMAQENWVSDNSKTIRSLMGFTDAGLERIQPGSRVPALGLIRCLGGGKTRPLLEIGMALKRKYPSCAAILFVSFEDETALTPEEQKDPLAALRRRIAFAASEGAQNAQTSEERMKAFELFRDGDFPENDLLEWLGDSPSVLLLDNLDALETINQGFADFIVEHFLSRDNRYFVFTAANGLLPDKLAKIMKRSMLVPVMPMVVQGTPVKHDREFDLTKHQVIGYDGVPGFLPP